MLLIFLTHIFYSYAAAGSDEESQESVTEHCSFAFSGYLILECIDKNGAREVLVLDESSFDDLEAVKNSMFFRASLGVLVKAHEQLCQVLNFLAKDGILLRNRIKNISKTSLWLLDERIVSTETREERERRGGLFHRHKKDGRGHWTGDSALMQQRLTPGQAYGFVQSRASLESEKKTTITARNSERATGGLERTERDSERAAGGLERTERDSERAAGGLERTERDSERAAGSLERTERDSERTAGSLVRATRGLERTAGGLEKTGRDSESTRGLERTAGGLEKTGRDSKRTLRDSEKTARDLETSVGTRAKPDMEARSLFDCQRGQFLPSFQTDTELQIEQSSTLRRLHISERERKSLEERSSQMTLKICELECELKSERSQKVAMRNIIEKEESRRARELENNEKTESAQLDLERRVCQHKEESEALKEGFDQRMRIMQQEIVELKSIVEKRGILGRGLLRRSPEGEDVLFQDTQKKPVASRKDTEKSVGSGLELSEVLREAEEEFEGEERRFCKKLTEMEKRLKEGFEEEKAQLTKLIQVLIERIEASMAEKHQLEYRENEAGKQRQRELHLEFEELREGVNLLKIQFLEYKSQLEKEHKGIQKKDSRAGGEQKDGRALQVETSGRARTAEKGSQTEHKASQTEHKESQTEYKESYTTEIFFKTGPKYEQEGKESQEKKSLMHEKEEALGPEFLEGGGIKSAVVEQLNMRTMDGREATSVSTLHVESDGARSESEKAEGDADVGHSQKDVGLLEHLGRESSFRKSEELGERDGRDYSERERQVGGRSGEKVTIYEKESIEKNTQLLETQMRATEQDQPLQEGEERKVFRKVEDGTNPRTTEEKGSLKEKEQGKLKFKERRTMQEEGEEVTETRLSECEELKQEIKELQREMEKRLREKDEEIEMKDRKLRVLTSSFSKIENNLKEFDRKVKEQKKSGTDSRRQRGASAD